MNPSKPPPDLADSPDESSTSAEDGSPKPDRLKPAMPRIPGVNDRPLRQAAAAAAAVAAPRGDLRVWRIAPVGVAVALGIAVAWWMLRGPHRAAPVAQSAETSQDAPGSGPGEMSSPNVRLLPDGSVEVGSVQELREAWSAKRFFFPKRFTSERVPAMVVRLPAPKDALYWAFSLQAPFESCELEYVTDLSKLASQYHYRARHPMVADPCNGAIYDPLQLGTLANGAWARGEVVQGPGIRPPTAIEVEVRGDHLVATRIE